MNKKIIRKGEGTSIISIIGDEDTVTGFLLTGIGERSIKGETNFLIVDFSNMINLKKKSNLFKTLKLRPLKTPLKDLLELLT